MVSVLRTNPNAGIVGPTLLTSEGRPEPNGTRFPTTAYELGKAFRLERFLGIEYDFTGYDDPERPKTVWNVDVVCGACMVIRRAVLDEIGGLDEQLFMFYEETDFCLRAHRAGWNTVYLPAAHVYHHWMGSVRQDEIRAARRFFRSRCLYFRKHHGGISCAVLHIFGAWSLLFRTARIIVVRIRERIRCRIRGITQKHHAK